MALNPQRWTVRTREAYTAAQSQAQTLGNPEIVPAHLLIALLAQPDGIAQPLLTSIEADPAGIATRLQGVVGGLPRAIGGRAPELGRDALAGLEDADRRRAEMGDDYLSVEHVLLAFAKDLGVEADRLLIAVRDLRGHHRVRIPKSSSKVLRSSVET